MKKFRLMFLICTLSVFIFSCTSVSSAPLTHVKTTSIYSDDAQVGLTMITDIDNEINYSRELNNTDVIAQSAKINVNRIDISANRRDKSINYFATRSVSEGMSKQNYVQTYSYTRLEYG